MQNWLLSETARVKRSMQQQGIHGDSYYVPQTMTRNCTTKAIKMASTQRAPVTAKEKEIAERKKASKRQELGDRKAIWSHSSDKSHPKAM